MERYENLVRRYLDFFCEETPSRRVGTVGNRRATEFFRQKLTDLGWATEERSFAALDWQTEGATLVCDSESFEVAPSPYSSGCSVCGTLVEADSIEKLEQADLAGKIVLLRGDLAKEPLMPKNFTFYNPDEHRRIVAALERSGVTAIVTAAARHAALAGGVYPFPVIEDGDFDIPSVYTTEQEGRRLATCLGRSVRLCSNATRIPSFGSNVTGRKDGGSGKRIIISAHIDAKSGTPGAIDNATGVIALLLLAEMTKDVAFSDKTIELLALNGEDYYAVPGQMDFLRQNQGKFGDIILNVNIDCAGYYEGPTAVSLMDVPENVRRAARKLIAENSDLVEGVPWFQGDHTLFLQNGVPAVVFASQWFLENIESQNITHTPLDSPKIVRPQSVVTVAETINKLLRAL